MTSGSGRGAQLRIDGMHCAACVGRVERVLRRVPGVTGASVNFATGQAMIDGESDGGSGGGSGEAARAAWIAALIAAVERAGYGARLPRAQTDAAEQARAKAAIRAQWARAAQSLAVGVPALGMMVPGLVPHAWMGPVHALLWLACLAVVLFPGRTFFTGAWRALLQRTGDMNTLVALGTGAALVHGAVQLWIDPHGHLYLDGVPITIGAVLAGQAWEAQARRQTADALASLTDILPARAIRLSAPADPGGSTAEAAPAEEEVPVGELRVGDRVRVRPGDRVPADGEVIAGVSTLDRSFLTGEPLPEPVGPGTPVQAGAINNEAALIVSVRAVGEEAALSRVRALVERAQATRPPVAALADRVAAVFVPGVIGVALLGLAGWSLAGQPAAGVQAALAVLVVACPCALGLATPISLVLGLGAAARRGVLLRDGAALQALSEIDTVLFDKTGTLSVGRPVVVRTAVLSVVPDAVPDAPDLPPQIPPEQLVLALAAAVERQIAHPLARAICAAAPEPAPGLPLLTAEAVRQIPGAGAEGTVRWQGRGWSVRVGSPVWLGVGEGAGADTPGSRVAVRAVCSDPASGLTALLILQDPLRPGAADALRALEGMGLSLLLLSGDHPAEAARVGAQLGIPAEGGLLPAQKLARLLALLAAGRRVAMVGDGVNDAPVLAAATVGMAMASGTDIAVEAASVTLQRTEPAAVVDAVRIARATLRNVRQNLAGAFAYNLIAIPAALSGTLHPAMAGVFMAASSLFVVGNALRLRKL